MKYIVLYILFGLVNFSSGQVKYSQTFDHLLVRDMKLIQDHYLLYLDQLSQAEFGKYILNCDQRNCSDGLAFMNSSLEYEWIYTTQTGIITDFWEDSNFIYILNAQRTNSKVSSSAKLFILTLDKMGTLISQEIIDEVEFDRPNGSFDAKFDQNGSIWKITNIPIGSNGDFSQTRPGKPGKSYKIESLSLNLKMKSTYNIEGNYLCFEAFDSKSDQVSFVFSADSARVNGKLIVGDNSSDHIPSLLLLRFNTQGELTNSDYIGSGSIFIEEIKYQGDNLIVGGSFKGNETNSDLPICFFRGIPLSTPKNDINNDLARNTFVASIDSNLTVNWLNEISGSCNILFNSLSATTSTVAISFNFKDSVNIEGNLVYSLKRKSNYQYSTPILCFFNADGELTSNQQLKCYSSGWNKIFLFPNKTAIHGTFFRKINVYGKKLTSKSKNSVYYLTFVENEERL